MTAAAPKVKSFFADVFAGPEGGPNVPENVPASGQDLTKTTHQQPTRKTKTPR